MERAYYHLENLPTVFQTDFSVFDVLHFGATNRIPIYIYLPPPVVIDEISLSRFDDLEPELKHCYKVNDGFARVPPTLIRQMESNYPAQGEEQYDYLFEDRYVLSRVMLDGRFDDHVPLTLPNGERYESREFSLLGRQVFAVGQLVIFSDDFESLEVTPTSPNGLTSSEVLETRERTSVANIIVALCKELEIDITKTYKSAELIQKIGATHGIELPRKPETIAKYLKWYLKESS